MHSQVDTLVRTPGPLSESEPILVHVGYSKAASTWLQERLFRTPRHGFWALFPEKSDRLDLNRMLVYPSAFDAPAPELQERIRERLAARPDRHLVPVASAEGLVGHEASPSGALARMLRGWSGTKPARPAPSRGCWPIGWFRPFRARGSSWSSANRSP